jgi:hypothetical protein
MAVSNQSPNPHHLKLYIALTRATHHETPSLRLKTPLLRLKTPLHLHLKIPPLLKVTPTTAAILDLLETLLVVTPPPCTQSQYERKELQQQDFFDLAQKYIPGTSKLYTSYQVNKWLSQQENFGSPKNIRKGKNVAKARILWMLKANFIGRYLENTQCTYQ